MHPTSAESERPDRRGGNLREAVPPGESAEGDLRQSAGAPEQHRMHKLMDYYLPTTLKTGGAVCEFDEVSSPGEEILEAKKEIGKTLDMINQAFVTLLNNLFPGCRL